MYYCTPPAPMESSRKSPKADYNHETTAVYRAQGTGRLSRCPTGLGLARQKLDRFVSVTGPVEAGTLTTIPLTYSGNRP